jgi:hypothetical protein
VYNDCEALSKLFKPGVKTIPDHVMLRDWAAKILQYNPRIIHKPGREMLIPDALSRHFIAHDTTKGLYGGDPHHETLAKMIDVAVKLKNKSIALHEVASQQSSIIKSSKLTEYALEDLAPPACLRLGVEEKDLHTFPHPSVALSSRGSMLAVLTGHGRELPGSDQNEQASVNKAPLKGKQKVKHQHNRDPQPGVKTIVLRMLPLTGLVADDSSSSVYKRVESESEPQTSSDKFVKPAIDGITDTDSLTSITEQLSKLASLQRTDPECIEIIDYMITNRLPSNRTHARYVKLAAQSRIIDSNGVLRLKDTTWSLHGKQPAVLPRCLWEITLSQYHDQPLSGHRKFKKLMAAISEKYYFPGMRSFIQAYCHTCPQCQVNTVTKKSTSKLNPYFAKYPGVLVHIDCTKGNLETKNGNKYIVAIVDSFTGYVKLYAVIQTNAHNIANVLVSYILTCSMPLEVISDNGPEFVNDLMAELAMILGLSHKFITPYNSKANGKVENIHKTSKSMLCNYMNEMPDEWDTLLPYIEFAINTSSSEVTGYTPFYLNFGRHPVMPLDVFIESPHKPSQTVDEHVKTMQQNSQRIFDLVAKSRADEAKKSSARYNTKHKNTETLYKVGDYVFITDKSKADKKHLKKFKPHFKSEIYTISEVLENGTYMVKEPNQGKPAKRVMSEMLKKARIRIDISAQDGTITAQPVKSHEPDPPKESETEVNDEHFEIYKILEHKHTKTGQYYKVQWKGYSQKRATWVHKDQINAKELISQFHDKTRITRSKSRSK